VSWSADASRTRVMPHEDHAPYVQCGTLFKVTAKRGQCCEVRTHGESCKIGDSSPGVRRDSHGSCIYKLGRIATLETTCVSPKSRTARRTLDSTVQKPLVSEDS